MSYAVPAVVAALRDTVPGRPFLRGSATEVTFAAMEARTRRLAAELPASGEPFAWGDRDPLAWPELLIAVLRVGVLIDVEGSSAGQPGPGPDVAAWESAVHSGTPAVRLADGCTVDHGTLLDHGHRTARELGLGPGDAVAVADVASRSVLDRIAVVTAALVTPCALVVAAPIPPIPPFPPVSAGGPGAAAPRRDRST